MKKIIMWNSVLFCSLLFVSGTAIGKETPEAKAQRIHSTVLTIDTHSDTPLNLLHDGFDVGKKTRPGNQRHQS